MVYAPYGRAGVYMLQDYCRRLGIGGTAARSATSPRASRRSRRTIPLRRSCATRPTSRTGPGLPTRCSILRTDLIRFRSSWTSWTAPDLAFGRWVRQAPYLPWCGALASTPHQSRLIALTPQAQYAAVELFRGTMVRHSVVAYRADRPAQGASVDFEGDAWLDYTPIRLPDTLTVRDRLPPGAAAVLINRNHTYTDLYLPIDARQERLLAAIDGEHTIAEICGDGGDRNLARDFFEQLWRWDQVVFDTSRAEDLGRLERHHM